MFSNQIQELLKRNHSSSTTMEIDTLKPYPLPDLSSKLVLPSEFQRIADQISRLKDGQHYHVTFVKRSDDTIRTLTCIAGVTSVASRGAAPYHAGSRQLIKVYHTGDPRNDDPAGDRNVPLDRIICLNILGSTPDDDKHFHTSLHDDPDVQLYRTVEDFNKTLKEMRETSEEVDHRTLAYVRGRMDTIFDSYKR